MATDERMASVRDAAKSLLGEADASGARGDTDGVIRLAGEAMRMLADDATLDGRWLDAAARFDRAVALRRRGATDEADAALRELATRTDRADMPELSHWTALALFNRGFVFGDVGRGDAAFDAFGEFVTRFADDERSPVRVRVATAIYQLAAILDAAGEAERVRAALGTLVERFGDAPEPEIVQLIAHVLGDENGRIDVERPARHATSRAAIRDFEGEMERRKRDDPEHAALYDEYIRANRELAEQAADAAAQRHAEAYAVLSAHRARGAPFALFLRTFDAEETRTLGTGEEGAVTLATVHPIPPAERALADALRRTLPVIGVANPSSEHVATDGAPPPFPQLELPDAVWRPVVHELIAGASLIVVFVTRLTPGVLWETEAIAAHGREASTVVVLAIDEEAADPLSVAMRSFYQVNDGARETLDEMRARLAAFPRVVQADALRFDDLRASRAFADLLPDAAGA